MTATPTKTEPLDTAQSTVAGHAIDRGTLPLLITLGLGVFAGALDLGVLLQECRLAHLLALGHDVVHLQLISL